MLVIAPRKIRVAAGAACSAARFMLSANSSTCGPRSTMRRPCSTVRSFPGIRVPMAAFPKKPPGRPVRLTDLSVATWTVSFKPASALASERPLCWPDPKSLRSWSPGLRQESPEAQGP